LWLFYKQINNGLWNCLAAMGFLWLAIFYLILGSGRFGIDNLLTYKKYDDNNHYRVLVFICLTSCVQKRISKNSFRLNTTNRGATGWNKGKG
jgi:hypothetical protein